MIRTLINLEFIMLYRERNAIVICIVCALLTVLALMNGQKRVDERLLAIEKMKLEQNRAIDDVKHHIQQQKYNRSKLHWWDDSADVRGYAFYLMVDYAVKPPTLLAPLAIGQSDIYPYFYRMQVSTKQAVVRDKNTDHPLLQLVGLFDLSFFLVFVLPLLLIALNFNAVARERESDQLNLLIIQGVSPFELLVLQLATRTGIILLPIVLIIGAWLIINSVATYNIVSLSVILQVIEVISMVVAYSVFWVALSAWCIAKGKTGIYNASLLVSFWLILVVAIPMTCNAAVSYLAPLPSRVTYIDSVRSAEDQVEKNSHFALSEFFHDHPEIARDGSSISSYAIIKLAKINAIEKSMKELERKFSDKLENQQRIAGLLKWLSPASLLYQSLVDKSGNGLKQQKEFLNQVESHLLTIRNYFGGEIISAHELGYFDVCKECQSPITFSSFEQHPRFNFNTNTEGSNKISEAITSIMSCFLMVLSLVSLLYVSGRRLRYEAEVGHNAI